MPQFQRVAECLQRNIASGVYYSLVKRGGKAHRTSLGTAMSALRPVFSVFCCLVLSTVGFAAEQAITFLGVANSPAPRLLTAKLGLPAGQGMVVLGVVSDSPAASVLKTDDVLVSIDGQKLTDGGQLATYVRAHKPGDEVTLAYLRGGKETVVKAKLSQVDSAALPPAPRFAETNLEFEETPSDQLSAEGLAMLEKGFGSLRVSAIYKAGDTRTTFSYFGGTVDVTKAGGKTSVEARNSSGAVTYSGAFNTDAEQLAAPASVQAIVECTATNMMVLRDIPPVRSETFSPNPDR